jgi:hypothetical protein
MDNLKKHLLNEIRDTINEYVVETSRVNPIPPEYINIIISTVLSLIIKKTLLVNHKKKENKG